MDRRAGDLGTVVANAAKAVVCRRRRGELEAKADFGWQTKRGLKEGLGSTICRVGSAKEVFESRVTAKFEFGRPGYHVRRCARLPGDGNPTTPTDMKTRRSMPCGSNSRAARVQWTVRPSCIAEPWLDIALKPSEHFWAF